MKNNAFHYIVKSIASKHSVDDLSPNMTNRDLKMKGPSLSNRIYPIHPTVPMRSGDENRETFKINRINHPKCPLTYDLYTIVKKEYNTDSTNFYVKFKAKLGDVHLGYSQCRPGWIEHVWIEEGALSKVKNARECGLATVLTSLCLIDTQLNYMYHVRFSFLSTPNKAMTELSKYPGPYDDVQNYCKKLMGMDMWADPKKGAHAYFRAALRTGYRRMIIFDGIHHHYFWVQDAMQRYISMGEDSGNIGLLDGCCCEACGLPFPCEAFGKHWYFCKDI